MDCNPRTDKPRTNRDPVEVERKLALLHQPQVAPLTKLVERLRRAKPDAAIPYFDPTEAGVNARIFHLLEAPGPRSAPGKGSGFVSADNNDQTAQNMWELLRDVGIDRSTDLVVWNVVPWYIGDGKKIRPARSTDFDEARAASQDLLALLPNLRVVVLFGRAAAKAWRALDIQQDLAVIEVSHPSPLNLNTHPERRDEIRQALRAAKQAAGIS